MGEAMNDADPNYATAHTKEHELWLELATALLWLGANEETLSLTREWGTAFAELYKLNVNGHRKEHL
jgi:hypothetical protein